MIWILGLLVMAFGIIYAVRSRRKADETLERVVEQRQREATHSLRYGTPGETIAASRAVQDRATRVIPTPPRERVVVNDYNPLLDPMNPISPFNPLNAPVEHHHHCDPTPSSSSGSSSYDSSSYSSYDSGSSSSSYDGGGGGSCGGGD